MKKTMKRFPIIIALLLASCTPGKIDPRTIIEAELMKVLNDPESYEFVSLEKLDSSSYAMQINKDRELYEYFSNDNLDDDSPFEIYYRSALDTLNTIVEHDCQLNRSTFNVLRVLSHSLLDKTSIRDLFSNSESLDDRYIEDCSQLKFDFVY